MTSPGLTPLRSGLAGGLIELRQAFSGAALAGQLLWPAATLIALFFFRHRELAGSRFSIGALMLPGTLGMFVAFGMMLMVRTCRPTARTAPCCAPGPPPMGSPATWPGNWSPRR